ncbi:hypothetical protein PoB_005830100 [Plakobranchus ocellatus]|uniref:Uncharacterized protein n=1 Tax=Plakobranchus ocellatus TaxID=259542 RepID=A0AAV4C913_9GAST|nr:hypothetical protein PoB_005830100 [Plakobranchus ocellatus]
MGRTTEYAASVRNHQVTRYDWFNNHNCSNNNDNISSSRRDGDTMASEPALPCARTFEFESPLLETWVEGVGREQGTAQHLPDKLCNLLCHLSHCLPSFQRWMAWGGNRKQPNVFQIKSAMSCAISVTVSRHSNGGGLGKGTGNSPTPSR